MIGPAVSAGLNVVAASMVAAIDQYLVDAGRAHLAELREGRRDPSDIASARILDRRGVAGR
jgi:hypothetical protein